MVDVQRVRVLRAVAATGSITGAANSLGYTASAISQHLTALQRETGLTLVQRSGRGVELTPAGRQLASEARRLFEDLAALDALVGDLRSGRSGRLTVRYFASAGAAWIPPIIAAITREFPLLRLDLRVAELTGADAGEPDVDICVEGAVPAPAAGFQLHPLGEDPYYVVVPRRTELAQRDEVRLQELREHDWVDNDMAHGPCREVVLDACAAIGFAPQFRIQTQDYPSAIRFVAEGLGITVVPRLGLADLPASVVAVPVVDPTPVRRISLRIRDAVADHPAVVRIVELLDERVAGRSGAGFLGPEPGVAASA